METDRMRKPIAVVAAVSLLLGGCTVSAKIEPVEVEPVEVEPVEAGKEFGNQLGAIEYVIKAGDNLVLIASEQTRASENWRRIADFNQIQNPASIKVGQRIWIPKDLIPLHTTNEDTREIAGHPDAFIKSATLPRKIIPLSP